MRLVSLCRKSSALQQYRATVKEMVNTREKKKKHFRNATKEIFSGKPPKHISTALDPLGSKCDVYECHQHSSVQGKAAVKCCPTLRNSIRGLNCVLRNTNLLSLVPRYNSGQDVTPGV